MTGDELPIVAKAQADEALSSWLERIAIFYGTCYEAGLAGVYGRAGRPSWQRDYDLDTDPQLRQGLRIWTGVPDEQVPAILDAASDDTLPRHARLTFCPQCWDEDTEAGAPPYGRRRWLRWSVVHCPRHQCWLTARRHPTTKASEFDGWAPLWSSRAHWAKPFERSLTHSQANLLRGFEPSSLEIRGIDWPSLSCDLSQFERVAVQTRNDGPMGDSRRAILEAVRVGPIDSLRYRLAGIVAPDSRCVDPVDQCPSSYPVWLATRIVSMVIAVEYLRMTEGQPPLNAEVSELVRACRDLREAVRLASRVKGIRVSKGNAANRPVRSSLRRRLKMAEPTAR